MDSETRAKRRKKVSPAALPKKVEPLLYRDYCVRLIDMPLDVCGLTAMDDDGFANVYLNARLSHERRQSTLRHELCHLQNGDFDR